MKALALALLVAAASAAPADTRDHVVRVEHHDPAGAPARGPLDAPVTVELFLTPQINVGAQRLNAYHLLEQLQQDHPARMRLIYRVQRQGMIATAALEAQAQGKFAEFMDRIAVERQTLQRDALLKLCASLGIDADRVDAAIREDRYGQTFADTDRRAKRLHVAGTPSVLFNSLPSRTPFSSSSITLADLEKSYADAYARAQELLEQGVPATELSAAFDAKLLASAPTAINLGGAALDDEDTGEMVLATPPIDTTGLPYVGDDDSSIPVIFLCSPGSASCRNTIDRAIQLQKDLYPDLRIVWAPWFDVGRDDANDLAAYGDAAICAEQLGMAGAPPKSPGYLFVEALYKNQTTSRNRRVLDVNVRIDAVAKELELDSAKLSHCRAVMAGTTFRFIEATRASGVRSAPSVVVGGRIYPGLSDSSILQQLVEAELAPGISDTLHAHLGYWPHWH